MENSRFRTDIVLIAMFIIVVVFYGFLLIRKDINQGRDRDLRKEEIKEYQYFMQDCYSLEKKNWKSCRDKLLEIRDLETLNP